jgi:hypothetical protein
MKAFWKQAKYWVIAGGVLLAVVLFFLFRGLLTRENSDGEKTDILPEVEDALKERVRVAEEEALVARVEARVEAEADKQELEEVATIEDGAERRRRLAEMLRKL